jgi:predicted adenylyl cyclase CyaB
MTEIEVKFKVDGFGGIRDKLIKAGFAEEWDSEETSVFYDTPDGKQENNGITVRTKDIGGSTIFTVKQKTEGKFKSALEKECSVGASQDDFGEMLKIVGLEPVFIYSKHRTHYSKESCSVELDHIEETGEDFIELEAPSEEKLESLIVELGFSGSEPDTRSYRRIIKEHRDRKVSIS